MSMPSKGEILFHWKDWLVENGYYIDLCEPSCWACGYYYGDIFDIFGDDVTDKLIKRAWDKTPFQRCHIIPRSLGGNDDVSNLFIMCRDCHDLAPDTISRDLFLAWTKNQNYYDRKYAELKKCFDDFELSSEDIEELFADLGPLEIYNMIRTEEFKKIIGLHFNQKHGGIRAKTSTFVAAQIEYLRTKKKLK